MVLKEYLIGLPQRQLRFKKELGEGSFGVAVSVDSQENQTFAIKIISIDKFKRKKKKLTFQQCVEELKKEREVLIKLTQDNVVRFFDSWFYPPQQQQQHASVSSTSNTNFYYIKQELCDTNLKTFLQEDILKTQNDRVNNQIFIMEKIFVPILRGLEYIHSKNIMHRDIKPDNIFIKKDPLQNGTEEIICKIGDFGLARVLDPSERVTEKKGSECYMSPEMTDEIPYDTKTDIFSAGLMFYEILFIFDTSEAMFDIPEAKFAAFDELRNKNCEHNFEATIVKHYPPNFVRLIQNMTIYNFESRLSAAEILQSLDELPYTVPRVSTNISGNSSIASMEFVGRQAEINRLTKIVKSHQNSIVGVHGFAGVGKSSLCQVFAQEMKKKNIADYIFLDAESPFTLRSSIFKQVPTNSNRKSMYKVSLKHAFQEILKSKAGTGTLIVILDNYLGCLDDKKLRNLATTMTPVLEEKLSRALLINSSGADTGAAVASTSFSYNSYGSISSAHANIEEHISNPLLQTQSLPPNKREMEIQKEMRDFLLDIMQNTGRKIAILITTISPRNLPSNMNIENLQLKTMDDKDAEDLVMKLFKPYDGLNVSPKMLAKRLGKYPLAIRQAYQYYTSSCHPHVLSNTDELNDVNIDDICGTEVQDYPSLPIQISKIYDKLSQTAITILCVLSFFPNTQILHSFCVKFVIQLLTTFSTNGPGPSNCRKESITEFFEQLQNLELISVDNGNPRTVSIHTMQQKRVLESIQEQDRQRFWDKLVHVLYEMFPKYEKKGEFYNKALEMDSFTRVVFSIWENCADNVKMYNLKLSKFLDDNAYVYSKARFNSLKDITQKALTHISSERENRTNAENMLAFETLMSRYIYTAMYCYLDYTEGVTKLLNTRALLPNFIVSTSHNHSKFSNRTYLAFSLFVFTVIFTLMASPFVYTLIAVPEFNIAWFEVVGVAFLGVQGVLVPVIHIYTLATITSPILRTIAQYSLFGITITVFALHYYLEANFNQGHEISISDKPFLLFNLVAALSLITASSVRSLVAVIIANFNHVCDRKQNAFLQFLTIAKNIHFEFLYLVVLIGVPGYICKRFPDDASSETFPKYMAYGTVVPVVIFTFCMYNFLLLMLFNKFFVFSLWLSHKRRRFRESSRLVSYPV